MNINKFRYFEKYINKTVFQVKINSPFSYEYKNNNNIALFCYFFKRK